MPGRSTGKRQWHPEVSGVAMQKIREAAGFSKRAVSERLGLHPRAVSAIEDGVEPRQDVMAQLDALYGMDIGDWQTVYVPTDEEVERQAERDQRRAALTQQVASLGEDDVPIRFRGRQ
jgi:transcriptional regulator with XRE-family HTH domain